LHYYFLFLIFQQLKGCIELRNNLFVRSTFISQLN
jgi:hypothetical protein